MTFNPCNEFYFGRTKGHVARMEGEKSVLKILAGKLTGKRTLERLMRNGRRILECILKKYLLIQGIGWIRLRIGIIGEPS